MYTAISQTHNPKEAWISDHHFKMDVKTDDVIEELISTIL